jgi:hypothetical protein
MYSFLSASFYGLALIFWGLTLLVPTIDPDPVDKWGIILVCMAQAIYHRMLAKG